MNLSVKIEIFKEGEVYVALSPELNVSSFGETVEEARESLQEALAAFLEECEQMGTLEEILEEAGFVKVNGRWEHRKPVSEAALAFSL
jgi:predicted RNase H-like HicB family nuclease